MRYTSSKPASDLRPPPKGPAPGAITREALTALFQQIREEEMRPHTCIVHPKGGVCLECGQPWRLVNGRMEHGDPVSAALSDADVIQLADGLRRLRKEHLIVEDCWYSCPKSSEGCCNDAEGDDCNCGADAHNALIDSLLALLPKVSQTT